VFSNSSIGRRAAQFDLGSRRDATTSRHGHPNRMKFYTPTCVRCVRALPISM
jgi:hypothetical protein